MPELPEVEVVVRGLKKKIIGKTFQKVEIKKSKSANFTEQKFAESLQKQNITKVERIGKMIIVRLTKNILVFHLKMTGQLIYDGIFMGGHTLSNFKENISKQTRLIFTFTDQTRLVFNDQRIFGYCHLINANQLSEYAGKYGLDPITRAFKLADFLKLIQKHPQMKFKSFLLNQKFIAGIGNIYADEVAFKSQIHPETRLGLIPHQKWRQVYQNIKEILEHSIQFNGTTFSSFVNSNAEKGNFSQFLKVYGHQGEPCVNCGLKLKKIKVAGRGTVYCLGCQKKIFALCSQSISLIHQ
jgi:formamidopyrimidine-DNA glycosylase